MEYRDEDGWYECAYESALLAGSEGLVWKTPHTRWIEIDDTEDLAAAWLLANA
jgi:hypothetical protein